MVQIAVSMCRGDALCVHSGSLPHLSIYLRVSIPRGGKSPSVGAARLSPDRSCGAVLWPESFRGGCSVGAVMRMTVSPALHSRTLAR